MMRKALIIVLTLAAIDASVCSIVGDPNRLHTWDIATGRSIAALLSAREFGIVYSTVDDPSRPDVRFGWRGFGFVRGRMYSQPSSANSGQLQLAQPNGVYSNTLYAVFCPRWFIVGLLGAYPAFTFARASLRRVRRRRDRHGMCLKCEYDLTGNVSGICPECGTPVTGGGPPTLE